MNTVFFYKPYEYNIQIKLFKGNLKKSRYASKYRTKKKEVNHCKIPNYFSYSEPKKKKNNPPPE